eukprot:6490651-Amphidinium_carterae.3
MGAVWAVPGRTMSIDNVKNGGENSQGAVVNALVDVDFVDDADVGVFGHQRGQSTFTSGCFWCM